MESSSGRIERRRFPRVTTEITARLSGSSEVVSPPVSVVNISRGGVLVVFGEPVGLVVDDRVVISLQLSSGAAVLLGRVARGAARGDDFRTYVAVEFADGQGEEDEQLAAELCREPI